MNVTDKTGKVISIMPCRDEQDLVVITTNGILIRQAVADIRTIGRNTQGVTLIKTKNEAVVSVARIAHTGNKDVDDAETGEENEDNSEAVAAE